MNDNPKIDPVEIEVDDLPELETAGPLADAGQTRVELVANAVNRPRSRLAVWVFRVVVSLVLFASGVWAWDFVFGLLDRNLYLGGMALGLVALLIALLIAFALRELTALARLTRIEALQEKTRSARLNDDLKESQSVLADLRNLYRNRADTGWALAEISRHEAEIIDAGTLLNAAENDLMKGLDRQALEEVERASAKVAVITALVPLALVDVATALYANVSMIRRIAEVYGGRSGSFGAWRLTRSVFAHLAATGAVAIGDDLLGSALGSGVVSKLSRRFGEGLINGALTARVGIAAIELCRPMPFEALDRPKVSGVISRSLTGVFKSSKNAD